MRIRIGKDILTKTTKCGKSFSCLSSKRRDLCKVGSKLESCEGETALFCEPNNDEFCAYKRPFGDYCICDCPTRKEIYNRYKI